MALPATYNRKPSSIKVLPFDNTTASVDDIRNWADSIPGRLFTVVHDAAGQRLYVVNFSGPMISAISAIPGEFIMLNEHDVFSVTYQWELDESYDPAV